MGKETQPTRKDIQSEIKQDELLCAICLNIFYKPICSPCGHTFCFWCRFELSGGAPKCPFCRTHFPSFPRVCQSLYKFLWVAFPSEIEEREKEIKMNEQETTVYSPEFPRPEHVEDPFTMLSCSSCKNQLQGPVVMTCGHCYCFWCYYKLFPHSEITNNSPELEVKISNCLECDLDSQNAKLDICLVLRDLINHKLPQSQESCLQFPKSFRVKAKENPSQHKIVHFGCGCDGCGNSPLLGNRYSCKECYEQYKIGYDLCEMCFSQGRLVEGRFNQNHTNEHTMELVTDLQILFRLQEMHFVRRITRDAPST